MNNSVKIKLNSFSELSLFEKDISKLESTVLAKVDSYSVDASSNLGMLYICSLTKPVLVTVNAIDEDERLLFCHLMKKYEVKNDKSR